MRSADSGTLEAFDARYPPLLFLRKLKNAVDADPGNAGFPLGQPTLLGGDETAENAAFPEINGVIPFIAVFAGLPGFGLGKGVGLVDAAVEGFAAIFGQGLEDGGSPVGVGKGLPVGAVPGDAPGLSILIPPPETKTNSARVKAARALRRDMAISFPARLGAVARWQKSNPRLRVCQAIPGQFPKSILLSPPSFPRKRESRSGLPRLRHYTAVPSGFPLTRE